MLDEAYLWLPGPLQTLAVSALGFRNRLRRYGPHYDQHCSFLAQSESWSEDEIQEWQQEELTRLLRHAFKTVPHFRRLAPLDNYTGRDAARILRSLPLLEKAEIRAAPDQFTSTVYGDKERLPVMTTGTTGSPTTFLVDRASRQRHFAYFSRLLRWAGLDSRRWHAVLMGRVLGREQQLRRRPWRVDFANRRVYYSSYHITHDVFDKYANHFADRRYEWMEGYPSAIANLASVAQKRGVELPRPNAIIPSSETLDSITRKQIEDYFGQTIWEFYAAAEQAVFISQCAAGSLHINPEYSLVEFHPRGMDQDGLALYEMVATSFRNWAMPLIRYRTEDLVTLEEGTCFCGSAFPRVGRIVGRTSDEIILSDGRRVTGISNVAKRLPIQKSQLVQLGDDALEFRVVPIQSKWEDGLESILQRRLHDRLGNKVRVSIRLVDDIDPGPGGKFSLVKKS